MITKQPRSINLVENSWWMLLHAVAPRVWTLGILPSLLVVSDEGTAAA